MSGGAAGASLVRPAFEVSVQGPVRVPGTIWNAWLVHTTGLQPDDVVDILDGTDHVLDQLLVAGLS
jgi:hypothetical protein